MASIVCKVSTAVRLNSYRISSEISPRVNNTIPIPNKRNELCCNVGLSSLCISKDRLNIIAPNITVINLKINTVTTSNTLITIHPPLVRFPCGFPSFRLQWLCSLVW